MPPNSLSDHNIIGVTRKLNCKKYTSRTIKVRNYSKYNIENFKNELRQIPWDHCFAEENFDCSWNLFKLYLTNVINKHCPLTEKKVRGKESLWLTQEIKNLMHTRDLRCFKCSKSAVDWITTNTSEISLTTKFV